MKPYHIRLTFDIHIAPWRMDDPNNINNHDWSLHVFDRNLGTWVPLNECNRPGESYSISRIQVLNDETSGSTPEVPTEGVNS